jgi:hypothetical protein
MKTEINLFGMHIGMATQVRRRALVSTIYVGFAVTLAFYLAHDRAFIRFWVLLLTFYVARLLGGVRSTEPDGLLKPFDGNEDLEKFAEEPSSLWTKLTLPRMTDRQRFHNDERELRQRDRAHYAAYKILTGAIAIGVFAAYSQVCGSWHLPKGLPLERILWGSLLAVFVASMTLPQAVLLWTEPDMEEKS